MKALRTVPLSIAALGFDRKFYSTSFPLGKRYAQLDFGRFLAAIGIVWLHTMGMSRKTATLGELGRFSVPFFALAAMLVMANGIRNRGDNRWLPYILGRVARITVPLLAWTAIYVLLRDIKHYVRPENGLVPIGGYLLLGGASMQLWFLPFLLLVSVGFFPVQTWLYSDLRIKAKTSMIARVALGALGLIICFVPDPIKADVGVTIEDQLTYVAALGWGALPAVCWGVAIGPAFSDLQRMRHSAPLFGFAFLFCMLAILQMGRSQLLENSSALLLLGAVFGVRDEKLLRMTGLLGVCSFGIYLIHAAAGLGLETLFLKEPNSARFGAIGTIFVASLTLSIALTWLLLQTKLTRWLVI